MASEDGVTCSPCEAEERHSPSKLEMLRIKARSIEHLMDHTPKNSQCPFCNSAKATETQHRKTSEQEKLDKEARGDVPQEFGYISLDHFFCRHPSSRGIDGEECCMVCHDRYTKFLNVYGQPSNLEVYVRRDLITLAQKTLFIQCIPTGLPNLSKQQKH